MLVSGQLHSCILGQLPPQSRVTHSTRYYNSFVERFETLTPRCLSIKPGLNLTRLLRTITAVLIGRKKRVVLADRWSNHTFYAVDQWSGGRSSLNPLNHFTCLTFVEGFKWIWCCVHSLDSWQIAAGGGEIRENRSLWWVLSWARVDLNSDTQTHTPQWSHGYACFASGKYPEKPQMFTGDVLKFHLR